MTHWTTDHWLVFFISFIVTWIIFDALQGGLMIGTPW